jgi:U3 small nucleolar RNA-associated protein 14
LEKQEDLQMAHLTVEEVQRRRQELRCMRELMFRADEKAKRVAKIKSKAYRKIKKKSKLREQEKLKESGLLSDGDEDEDELRLKQEIARARERATLRHKNAGKWTNSTSGKHELDTSSRDEIVNQLDRGEMLVRKIQGTDTGDVGDSEDHSDTGNEFEESSVVRALGEALKDSHSTDNLGKGVFSMNFMKQADARRSQFADQEALALVSAMDSENGEVEEVHLEQGPRTGKITFKPGVNGIHPEAPEQQQVLTVATTAQDSAKYSSEPIQSQSQSLEEVVSTANNPWLNLTVSSQGSKVASSKVKITQSKYNSAAEKSLVHLRKQALKTSSNHESQEDATVDICMDAALTTNQSVPDAYIEKRTTQESSESDIDDEIKHQEEMMKKIKKKKLNQRDLVAMAFAGDDVVKVSSLLLGNHY